MNKLIKSLCLFVVLLGALHNNSAVASDKPVFPMLSKLGPWLKQGNNGLAIVSLGFGAYLFHQYFKHKSRPKQEDISEEGFARRKYEIMHGDHSLYEKIALIISFIDDFYGFGRRPKSVEKETTTFKEDGTQVVIKEKETTIKGTGPVNFLYENVFDNLEPALKFVALLGAVAIWVDGTLSGRVDALLSPLTVKYLV